MNDNNEVSTGLQKLLDRLERLDLSLAEREEKLALAVKYDTDTYFHLKQIQKLCAGRTKLRSSISKIEAFLDRAEEGQNV